MILFEGLVPVFKSLTDRKVERNLVFMPKIINCDTNAPVLLDNINYLATPCNLYHFHLFSIPVCPTHYLKNNPL